MKKKIILFLISAIIITFAYKQFTAPPVQIDFEKELIEAKKTEVVPDISIHNNRSKNIQTFSSSEINIKMWKNGIRISLKGSLYYEKDKKLRFLINSFLGKEADLGSNDETFWFWFKRMRPKGALYYASHKDAYKTRLRTPLNPLWLIESLGVKPINLEKKEIKQTEENWLLTEKKKSLGGEMVYKTVILDKKTLLVKGYILKSVLTGEEIASGSLDIDENGMIKSMIYNWNRENTILQLNFSNPKFNQNIPSKLWKMPKKKKEINMAIYSAPSE